MTNIKNKKKYTWNPWYTIIIAGIVIIAMVATIFALKNLENGSGTAAATPTAAPAASVNDAANLENAEETIATGGSYVANSFDTANDQTQISPGVDYSGVGQKGTDLSGSELIAKAKTDGNEITLSATAVTCSGSGVKITDGVATISAAGTYSVTGTGSKVQIVVDAEGAAVILVLNNANLTNPTSAPIYVMSAGSFELVVADGTVNTVTDGATYTFKGDDDEPSSAIFCKNNMIISGSGMLTVKGSYKNAIQSKGGLTIAGGTITATAANDGIKGKDFVSITGGTITVIATGDGIKSTNDVDTTTGLVVISGGTITASATSDGIQGDVGVNISGGTVNVTSGGGSAGKLTALSAKGIKGVHDITITGGTIKVSSVEDSIHSQGTVNISGGVITISSATDGIQATGNLIIAGGTMHITSGGSSSNASSGSTADQWGTWGGGSNATTSEESDSAKGIKSEADILIGKASITVDSSDDSIHSSTNVTINSGLMNLSSGDDGMHADTLITINGGTITLKKSYEAVEAQTITVKNGKLNLTSSDDGFNVSGGSDSSSQGGPGQNQGSTANPNELLTISGGYIYLNATGDGLDSNGSINMSDGFVVVNGPTANDNGAIDYNGTFTMTGGTLIAAGSAGMAESISTGSSCALQITSSQNAGTLVRVEDADGKEIMTFAPAKTYGSVVFASPSLKTGSAYQVYFGGSYTGGTKENGYYSGGSYSGGTLFQSVTISSTGNTTVGESASNGMGAGGGGVGGGMSRP